MAGESASWRLAFSSSTTFRLRHAALPLLPAERRYLRVTSYLFRTRAAFRETVTRCFTTVSTLVPSRHLWRSVRISERLGGGVTACVR